MSPDGNLLAGSFGTSAKLFDISDPSHPNPVGPVLESRRGNITWVTFSPDGRILATASDDNSVTLWDVSRPDHAAPTTEPLIGHASAVTSIAFSPNGRIMASGSDDKTIRLWAIDESGRAMPVNPPLVGHTDSVTALCFSPDGNTLASGSADGLARLWYVAVPALAAPLDILAGHTGAVESVAYSPDGRTLASVSDDKTARLWDVHVPGQAASVGSPLTGHTGGVTSVAFSPDGRFFFTASYDDTVRIWNFDQRRSAVAENSDAESLSFSPDGRTLAVETIKGLVLHDLTSLSSAPVLVSDPLFGGNGSAGHGGAELGGVAFSPDGRTLAIASDGQLRLLNLSSREGLIPWGPALRPAESGVRLDIAANPRSPILAVLDTSAGMLLLVDIHDPSQPKVTSRTSVGAGIPWRAQFSSDGRAIAIVKSPESDASSNTLLLWDIAEAANPHELAAPIELGDYRIRPRPEREDLRRWSEWRQSGYRQGSYMAIRYIEYAYADGRPPNRPVLDLFDSVWSR